MDKVTKLRIERGELLTKRQQAEAKMKSKK